jgi:hypothetical protein
MFVDFLHQNMKKPFFLWFPPSTRNQTGNSDSNHFCGNANKTEKSQIWPICPKTYIFGSGQAWEKNELGLIAFVDATGQTPSSLNNHKSERLAPKATFWVPDSSVRNKQMGRMVFVDATGPNPQKPKMRPSGSKHAFGGSTKTLTQKFLRHYREGNHFWGSYRTLEKPLILTNGPETTGSGIGGRPFGYVSATRAISTPITSTWNDNNVAAADVLISNKMYRLCIKNRSYNSS